jgi:DNA-binding transcriptional regulator YiaG
MQSSDALEMLSSGLGRVMRRTANVTCDAMAGELGVSRRTVERWETAESQPHPLVALAYFDALERLSREAA